jgi:ABC-2 type transport system permease protein
MVAAMTRMEITLNLRRGESVLITLVVPAVLLMFFGSFQLVPDGMPPEGQILLPGMLSLAVMSAAMVSLGIATAFERHYGVLKRLGGSPLPRSGMLISKALGILTIEALQVALLLGIAAGLFGWRPTGTFWLLVPLVLLGTAAFAGIGLLMAGTLRSEATLAGANGLFVVFLLLGDMVFPLENLPAWLGELARLLPAGALTDVLRGAVNAGAPIPAESVVLLCIWAVLTLGAAAKTFRWE